MKQIQNQGKFAKVFQYEDVGQVLLIQDQTEPKISFMFYPKGYGIVTLSNDYKDFKESDNYFERFEKEEVYKVALELFKSI